jgi:hypothetical protein
MATPVMITNIRWGNPTTSSSYYSTISNTNRRYIPFLRRSKRLLLPHHLHLLPGDKRPLARRDRHHLRKGLHREDDLRQRSQAAAVLEQCGD